MLLLLSLLSAPMPPDKPITDGFLVGGADGLAFLGPDGKELSRREAGYLGTLSPDGRRLARTHLEKGDAKSTLVIETREGKDGVKVPGVGIGNGEGCGLAWSVDGKKLLVVHSIGSRDGEATTTHRVYDQAKKKLAGLDVPEAFYARGWSKDGKRLLGDWREGGVVRVCWLAAD
ncbi:MAG: hypothetical protein K2W96_11180, partial [Gemmataceae bacterium]|nr:hypothetical protein [Gemmataceae bacterium]